MKTIKANFYMPVVFIILFFNTHPDKAQQIEWLDQGWTCKKVSEVSRAGEDISKSSFNLKNWIPATVPGTVLTTLLNNKLIPDPAYGMNNEKIPDIYDKGVDYYTYWFVKDEEINLSQKEEQVWLNFRGINYSCDVFLNGHKLNKIIHRGMFLRQVYNITPFLSHDGKNRIAVIVYPPDPPGDPNGGQGGDGTIGRLVAHQYVAGWDWIQPVRDRNTGIWDKVYIEKTLSVNIKNTRVITHVPGIRNPENKIQEPALIKISTDLENAVDHKITGLLKLSLDGKESTIKCSIPPKSVSNVQFPEFVLDNPKLWWPNGYGPQNLYDLKIEFLENDTTISDSDNLRIGVREITSVWNPFTKSRQFELNGQKIFIKGGNWIISDAMLRFSAERYDAEVRFHRDMNLNLIRIWGGAITERPEFYDACDKYGILVWQEFWMSGDCNGRWEDPKKKDDQWGRRQYPDDHALFITSAVDMIKMIRNHPSLAIWCGGNEITPPNDINSVLKDTLASELDGTRLYLESSTTGDLYDNFMGSTGDGPYGIQPINYFWGEKSYPFNPELGSIGMGDYESLQRFIPDSSMIVPGKYHPNTEEPGNRYSAHVEPVWRYHKYIGYGNFIEKYGIADNVKEFAKIAQLINYNQYRAMAEGFSSRMWDWYTGFIIWKTQNPWTALRGQMYDWYLDPNAGLYGLHHGSEPLHIMYDPVNYQILVANNTFSSYNNLMAVVKAYDSSGKIIPVYQQWIDITPSTVKKIQSIEGGVKSLSSENGLFLSMKLLKSKDEVVSENLYWLPDSSGTYPLLQNMPKTQLISSAKKINERKIEVNLSNDQKNPLAFFIRVSLVNTDTGKRILPVFYSDNYISIEPGEKKIVYIETNPSLEHINQGVQIEGWNVESRTLKIE